MRLLSFAALLLFLSIQGLAQNFQTIEIHYFENYPFCYVTDDGRVTGIEAEIMVEFAEWLKVKSGIVPELKFIGHDNFQDMYRAVQGSGNPALMGAGTVSIADFRRSEIAFSAPYLRNKALVISNGKTPTLITVDEASKHFAGKTALVIEGSVHEQYIRKLKDRLIPDLSIEYARSPEEIVRKVSSDKTYFGMVDLVSYWNALPQQSEGYVKIQRAFNTEDDFFAFIFPASGSLRSLLNEFLEAGFGFTSTRTYGRILSRHLGEEIVRFVEIDQF